MELVSETLFLMILLNSAIGDIQHANFVNDISKTNQVFGDSLFNITTPSLLKCVAKCNVVKECLAVSITMYGVDCRGYQRLSDPSPYLGVKVWKKEPRCPANFTYTTTLDLCWRWYSQKATWTEAKTLCLEEDGRLVVFNSKEKFDFIRDDIRGTGNSGYYWIGGTFVANMWKWLDGTAVNMTTTFWGPGEPNGRHLPADCIGWNLFTHGKFDDGLCSLPDRNSSAIDGDVAKRYGYRGKTGSGLKLTEIQTMVLAGVSGGPETVRRTAGLERTSNILRTCFTTVIVVLVQCLGFVEGGGRMVALDNNTCQFAVYDISIQTSYSVSWDGRVLPRLCRLGFRVPNVNYYQICVSAATYDVTDCGFNMQYYHGLSTQPNRNYTCTTPPVRYCVNSTRYFYLHFTAKQASSSHVTIDIIAKARQKPSQRSSSMMEVLVGGLASILFVGFSCFVFGARSKNPCLCLRKLFGQFDACRPCVTRMESNGCVPPQPEAPSSNRIPREECCSHSACCILLGCAINGNVERTQGQTSGRTHGRAGPNIPDQTELDQPPPYNSLTPDGRTDPSEIIQPPPIWIQMSPPPYEAPPPAYEDIISNK